jgi:hypothetical protein
MAYTRDESIDQSMEDTDLLSSSSISKPRPTHTTVSGLYGAVTLSTADEDGTEAPAVIPTLPLLKTEELRLDVDGRYPQMTASGMVRLPGNKRANWIASLTSVSKLKYTGNIWYREPADTPFKYTDVAITVKQDVFEGKHLVAAEFSGGGLPVRKRKFKYRSKYFHKVEFEFDHVDDLDPVLQLNTGDHPNRPPTLPVENLSIRSVFQRTGFDVSIRPSSVVPIGGAGAQWSDMEMHDAMQASWSRFADSAQWSMWVFFAQQHELGSGLGGVMFDDIGPNHRQGTAIFYDSFISEPEPGDPAPAAFVARNRVWTAVHEMGHAFNLAHSWQKALPVSWIPLVNEPEARSFMNYPYNVAGGQSAFYSDFEYRFSDPELLFMRHAPAQFVQMGNADWFDHHGFEQTPGAKMTLEVRANRDKPVFEFMEPVVLELKLKNVSNEPLIVDKSALGNFERLSLVMKKRGRAARQYVPYARYCSKSEKVVLPPGEALYENVFVSAGLNGFDLADPGNYLIQASLGTAEGDIVSRELHLTVRPPKGYEEEKLAQDLYMPEVGRVLAFDGSKVLTSANDVLREATERLPDSTIARHAQVALGKALLRPAKVVSPVRNEATVAPANVAEAQSLLDDALLDNADCAAETLSHIDYRYYAEDYAAALAEQGDTAKANEVQATLVETLKARNVKPEVIQQLQLRRAAGAR